MATSGYRIGACGRSGKTHGRKRERRVARWTEARRWKRTLCEADEWAGTRAGKAVRQRGAESKARVYADVNESHPREYWDYEALEVQWG